MKVIVTVIFVITMTKSFAAGEKIDWKPCEKEVKEFCTTIKDDHEKHECLEEAPKNKISKTCNTFNESLESKFKEKHTH